MKTPPTVAVIDVGSNSIKLLVAAAGARPGGIETRFTETIETRISAGISGDPPRLSENAIRAGSATIDELFRLARVYDPTAIRIVATSAVRDAINGRELVDQVQKTTGAQIQVLSGSEEATYIGRGLACDPQIAGIDPFIQMDLGGGSLELIRFAQGHIGQAISLRLGAVRLTEQFISDRDTPIDSSVERSIEAHVKKALQESGFSFDPQNAPLVATGGAFAITRAILAARTGLKIDERSPRLQTEEITSLKQELSALPLHERMRVPHLPAARADILPTALITIETLLHHAKRTSVNHSFFNLRYGIAIEMLSQISVN